MAYPSAALKDIVNKKRHPAFPSGSRVWNLNLDQIESGTGRVLSRVVVESDTAGNSTSRFTKGTVLYSKLRPYLNKVVVADDDGVATTELVQLNVRPEVAVPEYVAQYLRSDAFLVEASEKVTGAKMPRVILDWFWNHEIPLPPIEEQWRIAKLLDEADEIQRLRKEANERAQRILPALFTDMFGDPETNPKHLDTTTLGDVIRVKSGDFLPAKTMHPDGTHPVYGGNGVNGFHDKYLFDEPTIVIGRVGQACGAVHLTEPRSWVTDNALYVCEVSDDLIQGYLVDALRMASLRQYGANADLPSLSGARLKPVVILKPSLESQTAYAERAAQINAMLLRQEEARAIARQAFSVMREQLFAS